MPDVDATYQRALAAGGVAVQPRSRSRAIPIAGGREGPERQYLVVLDPSRLMPRFVAFLRAINVGGHVVTMDQLRAAFQELGFDDVETFIASGNVIFSSPAKDPGTRTQNRTPARGRPGL